MDADYLSRRPTEIEQLKQACTESVDLKCLGEVMSGAEYSGPVVSAAVVAKKLELKSEGELKLVSRDELRTAQEKDEVVGPVYRAVVASSRPCRK